MDIVRAKLLSRVTQVAFTIAVIVLFASAFVLYRNVRELEQSSQWVEHTQQVLLTQQKMMTRVTEMEATQRAFAISGDAKVAALYDRARERVLVRLNELLEMIADNESQAQRVLQLKQAVLDRVSTLDQNKAAGVNLFDMEMFAREQAQVENINKIAEKLAAVESELLQNRRAVYQQNYRDAVWGIVLTTVVALATIALGFFFVNRDASARRRIAADQTAAAEAQKQTAAERERAAAEQERLARHNTLILNSTGEGIIGIDPTGKVTFANRAAGDMLGFHPETSVGQPFLDLTNPLHEARNGDESSPELQGFPPTRTAVSGDPSRGDDYSFRRVNGTRFPVEYSSFPIQERGQLAGAVIAFSDITKRKVAEQEIEDARLAAEQSNVAKSQFLANMSHELRTPLNAVILYSELLQEEAADRGINEFGPDLEKIRSAGKHLLSLVNGVLDLSKIEAGKMDLYLETFDVAEIIQDVVGTIQPLVEKKENKLELQTPGTLGRVHGDLTKTRQILFNFLSNAAKFTEKGTVTLAVDRGQSSGREVITYTVRDTGIGMTDEQLGKLFQPFTQADESTTRKFGGTGLGLTICKKFAEMMGGEITVTSKPDHGTTFIVQLPVTVGVKAYESDEVAPAPAPLASGLGPKPEGTVLVIDDNPDARAFLVETLAKEGLTAVTASDGEAGLKMAKSFRPAAIFLDVIMPKMDGWAVLTALKKDPNLADVPVIMLTVASGKDLGYTLGAADYLTKPVDPDHLISVIRKHCTDTQDAVLVVDDDDASRAAMRRALTRSGFVIDEAINGADALTKTANRKYALIILDLIMPVMDGFTFVRQFRQLNQDHTTPIVIVTSKDLTPGEREKLTGQVEAVMQKGGYSLEELQTEIHRLAGRLAGSRDSEPTAAV